MLIAALVSALAVTASAPSPWACDLAPSFGQGSADEGHINSISSLAFGCRYELLNVVGIGLSPVVGIDKQLWSVYEKSDSNKNLSSYEAQNFNFGVRLDRPVSGSAKIFYSLMAGQGNGTLNLTQSTEQSSLNSRYSKLKNNYIQHSLGASYGVTERLSLSLAFQRMSARQSWSVDNGSILLQNVDEENHLTLSEGVTALVGSPVRTSSKSDTNLIQLGVSFNFSK